MGNINVVIGRWGSYNECNERALGSDWLDLSDYDTYEEIEEELKKQGFELEGIDEELFIQVINKSQNGDDSLLGTVIPHCAEDWANKNHFDYRGLIEKGLAIEASNETYKQ